MNWQTRILQGLVLICGLLPVIAGGSGVYWGYSFIEVTPANIGADSHFRYLSGLLLALGLCFWSCVPHILNKTERFRLLSTIVIIGGVCRLYSYILYGFPGFPMLGGLLMELVIVPLLCLSQGYLAKHKS